MFKSGSAPVSGFRQDGLLWTQSGPGLLLVQIQIFFNILKATLCFQFSVNAIFNPR